MVTKKQNEFLEKLLDHYGKDPLPSFDTICRDLELKSKNSVWQYVQKLIQEGLITERNNRFFISGNLFGVEYFEQGVRAGFPSPAEDYTAERISFDDLLVPHPASTFTVKVVGDSMIEAGIFEGDLVVVERGKEAKNGDMIVAMVDGDFTLKYYRKKSSEVWLEPANSAYPIIKPREELQIFGKVTAVVRKI